jgi:hypothetical protein
MSRVLVVTNTRDIIIIIIIIIKQGLGWWIDLLTTHRSQLQITVRVLLITTLKITKL